MGRQVIAGPIYSVADLGTLGGSQTTAWSVNRSGVVTGFGTTANGDTRGFIYETGALHAIGAGPDAMDTQAYGVNNGGQAVVNTATAAGGDAYIYNGGVLQKLGSLGGTTTSAIAINNSGQVVGMSTTATGAARAFLGSLTNMRSLGMLAGGSWSSAYGVNDSGTVVGYSDTARGSFHGFVWNQASGMTDIGTFGGANSYAMNVNASGDATGHAQTASGYLHAFVRSGGAMQDIGTLGGAFRVT